MTTVYTTVVKLADFYEQNPGFWFAQIEGQFVVKKIDDDQMKFHYVMVALPQEVAVRVMPAVKSKSFETMKKALLDAFDLTQAQRATKLLHLRGLGDKLPSVLASEIITLCPEEVTPDYLERQIFIEQLPGAVQQDMAAHEEVTDFMKLAKIADRYVIAAHAREASMSCAVMVPQSSSDTWSQSQPTSVMVSDSASG